MNMNRFTLISLKSMAMGNGISLLLLLEFFVFVNGHEEHIVGDSIWSIPPTNDFYTNWSSSYSFHTGDTLYFEFDSGLYNVVQVSRGGFESCSGDQPLTALTDGPAVFALSRKGVFYFVCNVSNYCWLGLKVSVIVDEDHEEEEERRISPSPSQSLPHHEQLMDKIPQIQN